MSASNEVSIPQDDSPSASLPPAPSPSLSASPPPAPLTPDVAPDPARELHRLAERLVRGPDRRVLLEFLRLRRTLPRANP